MQALESHQENLPTPTKTASGMLYYGFRFYSPELGRWVSRDLVEELGGVNIVVFVGNEPNTRTDALGLFAEGTLEGAKYKGHSDFPEYGRTWDTFNWNLEDEDIRTGPIGPGLYRHFRSRQEIYPDLTVALAECDKDKFERLMHQFQDTYVHYDKGYRVVYLEEKEISFPWISLKVTAFGQLNLVYGRIGSSRYQVVRVGHASAGHKPDEPPDLERPDIWPEFDTACAKTSQYLALWNKRCCKDSSKQKWVPK